MVETSGRKRNFLVVLPLFSSLSHNNSSFFFPRTCSVLLNSILALWCVSAPPPSYLIAHSLLWEGKLLGNIPVDVWECNLTLSALAIYTHVHIHIHKLSYLQEHSEVGVQNNGMLYVYWSFQVGCHQECEICSRFLVAFTRVCGLPWSSSHKSVRLSVSSVSGFDGTLPVTM